jgi:hypothetical protein
MILLWLRIYLCDPHKKLLTELLKEFFKGGVKEFKILDKFYAEVTFNNNYKFVYWIANKYYSYCDESKIITPIPGFTPILIQHYRPSCKIIYKLAKLEKEYRDSHFI